MFGNHLSSPITSSSTKSVRRKREAVLQYMKDDRAKATDILDIDIEVDLLVMYRCWLEDNVNDAKEAVDFERASYFAGLYVEVDIDWDEVTTRYYKLGIKQKRTKDGTWEIKGRWENFSGESEGLHSSSSEIASEHDDSSCEGSTTNDPRICTAAKVEEELIWLLSIDPEAYPPLESDGEVDDEESQDSSDSDAYTDARSTISGEDEEGD